MLVQIFISAIFIAACVRIVSLNSLREAVIRAEPGLLSIVLILMLPAIFIRAWRWWYIIVRKGVRVPLWAMCKATLIGHAYNIFLPASLGDFLRSYYGWREFGNKEVMLASAIVDKVVALFSLCLLGFFCSLAIGTNKLAIITGIITLGLTVLLLWSQIIPWHWGIYLFKKVFRKEMSGNILASTFDLDKQTLLGSIGISLLGWGATNLMYYFSWRAFTENVPIWYSFAVAPLINLMRMLPITISGIGSTDLFIIYLFRPVGMSDSNALMGSMVINAVLIVLPGVIGAGMMVRKRRG